MKLFEFLWVRNAKSAIFRQNPHIGTSIESGYQYPLDRGKVVPVSIKVVLVSIHQKRLVQVQIKVVSILMLPVALIFVPCIVKP